jgi:hypothetical protein
MGEEDWTDERFECATQRLRDTNAGLVREIEGMGAPIELTMARIEHFILFLVTEGVITKGQQFREQYKWEKGLREQLIHMRDGIKERVRQIHEMQRKEMRRQQEAAKKRAEAARTPVPEVESKPSLILPPGVKSDKDG